MPTTIQETFEYTFFDECAQIVKLVFAFSFDECAQIVKLIFTYFNIYLLTNVHKS